MQSKTLDFDEGFRVAFGNARAQGAVMTIAPGEREGDAQNRHAKADQWLYVVEGSGTAVVEGEPHPLRPGVLLLVEKASTTRCATTAGSRSRRSTCTCHLNTEIHGFKNSH